MPFISSIEQKNKKGSRLLKKLKTKINTPIAAILTVNTIAHTIGAAGVGAQSAKIFGQEYMFLISGILTLLILYFSEIIPKTIGAIYWKKLAISSAYLINGLIYITYPLTKLAEYTTRIFAGKEKNQITREELLANALLSEDAGEINESESDIIENTLGLSKNKVKDILTPRAVVFALNKDITVAQAIENLNDLKTFSRIPLYDENIDKITAKVLSKEILLNYIENSQVTLESFAKPIYSIHENIPVSKTLSLMLQRNEHLLVVNDSFGQTSGVVSMEDCLETILGKEIVDESDQVEDLQELAKKLLKKK
jgi:CBS domain containing-hemolysin-like protein